MSLTCSRSAKGMTRSFDIDGNASAMRMKKLLPVFLLCSSLSAHGAEMSGTTCYATERDVKEAVANHGKIHARIELRIDTDAATGKYLDARVRYGAAKPWIPLVFAGESLESRGGELTTTWTEIVDGKPHGEYVLVTLQGASHTLSYTHARTGKRHTFVSTGMEVGTAYNGGNACDWDS